LAAALLKLDTSLDYDRKIEVAREKRIGGRFRVTQRWLHTRTNDQQRTLYTEGQWSRAWIATHAGPGY
jgi:hypothetical protein